MLEALEGKTLLVTGATGFIGSHLVARLRQIRGAKLVLLSRRPRPPEADSVIWIQADCQILSPQLWHSVGVSRLDYVFHLAAETPKVGGATESDSDYVGNLTGTVALLESLPTVTKRFIFASTLDVYAPFNSGETISETSPIGPCGPYGVSKAACEHAVDEYSRSRGFNCTVLRYGHIYGPGEEAYCKLIPQAIRQLLLGQSPVVYGDGSTERDYLYVADVVEATLRAATSGKPSDGPVNIVRGVSIPIRSVVETLASLTNFRGNIRYLTDKPPGNSLRFDNRKMRVELGDWLAVPLEIGLRREVDYFRASCQSTCSSPFSQ